MSTPPPANDTADTADTADTHPDHDRIPHTQKRVIPLENNPTVMTSLIHSLGLSPALSFQDVYSLTDPDLLSFVPRPAYALLLVFPVSDTYEEFRRREDGEKEEYEGWGKGGKGWEGQGGEEVVWWKQTIGNACGLMGVLHAACNGGAREFILPSTPLSTLLTSSLPLSPIPRANLLYNTPSLYTLHTAAASTGDTAAPSANTDVDLHYVCFVVQNGRLWELDGRRKGPLDRGEVPAGEDVLGDKALEVGVKAFLEREEGGGDVRFSLVVLAPGGEE